MGSLPFFFYAKITGNIAGILSFAFMDCSGIVPAMILSKHMFDIDMSP